MNFSSNTDSFNKYGFIRRNTYFKVKHPPLCKSIFTVKSMVCAKCKQLCFLFFSLYLWNNSFLGVKIDPAKINLQHSLSEEVSNLSLQVFYIKGQGCLFSRKINFPFPFPFLKINDFRGNNKNKNKHFYVHFLQYLDGGSF